MKVPASGWKVGDEEWSALHAAVDRHWLTAGESNAEFEAALQDFTGLAHVRTCNSGSSANLLAVASVVESGQWKAGDEIVTVAAGFPTTLNPLLLYGLKPVFVDISLPTYQVNVEHLERAISHRTRGIVLAHTLGNPFNCAAVEHLADQYGLTLIEDCCDALGSTYQGEHVGKFGSLATCSFFPAHHITTGEGGAVMTDDDGMARVVESIRDWGRDCWCAPGQNATCGARFDQQHGDLPHGYDHKYTFTHLGYNLKLNELAAAFGVVQARRAGDFRDSRRKNFLLLASLLRGLASKITLPEPTEGSDPSWFGFPITIKEEGVRPPLQKYLAQNGVDSRLLFGGNLTKQPYMKGRKHLVASTLEVTDKVMNDGLWIGLHPALTEEQLEYAAHHIKTFFGEGF